MSRAMKDSGVAWIGEIPEGWDHTKLKFRADFILEPYSESLGEYPYIGLENIAAWNGKYIETNSKYDLAQSVVFQKNDILFGKLRPYLAKVYHCTESGCCSGEFCVIRAGTSLNVRYLWNLLVSVNFINHIDSSTYGTKMPRANVDYIKNTIIPVPPLPEQSRIAAFLDRRCAEIDRVMAQTRETIEEYKRLKQSIITEAVTHGVRGERKMKDSGVEWIGEIPEEWELVKGKGLFTEVDNRSVDGAEELLTVSQYTGITPRSQKNVNMFEAETLEGYKICEIGDIAANTMWLWAGAIGVSQYRGVISPSYNIYRQTSNNYIPEYLDFLLRVPPLVQHYESLSTGIRASRLRLYPQQFLGIRFIVPPIEEQAEILDYLQARITEMDHLIAAKENLLTQLEAYKKSVIYEYVTGKKEVV